MRSKNSPRLSNTYFIHGLLTPIVSALPITKRQQDSDTSGSSSLSELAQGTQDLSAIIGLFATESVERYAVNFGAGPLCVAMSTSSMLGMLGWVRTMMKLSLGDRLCGNAGFSISALRPLLGVARDEALPKEEMTEITYCTRHVRGKNVVWTRVRRVLHTQDSMPCTSFDPYTLHGGIARDKYPFERISALTFNPNSWLNYIPKRFVPSSIFKFAQSAKARLKQLWSRTSKKGHHTVTNVPPERLGGGMLNLLIAFQPDLVITLLFLILTTGATTFPIIPLSKSYTWTMWFASIGLFVPLVAGTMLWFWVYCKEQVPGFTIGTLGENDQYIPPQSLAFFYSDPGYVVMKLHAIEGPLRIAVRLLSLAVAAFAIVGYLCQYSEIRNISHTRSGIWLGIQAGLALLRVLTWLLVPVSSEQRIRDNQQYHTDDIALNNVEYGVKYPEYMSEYELVLARFTQRKPGYYSDHSCLIIPEWIVSSLLTGAVATPVSRIFGTAYLAFQNHFESPDVESCLAAETFWDFPDDLFYHWLLLRNTDTYTQEKKNLSASGHRFCCRVIQSPHGIISLWPGILFQNNSVKFFSFPEQWAEDATCIVALKDAKYSNRFAPLSLIRVADVPFPDELRAKDTPGATNDAEIKRDEVKRQFSWVWNMVRNIATQRAPPNESCD